MRKATKKAAAKKAAKPQINFSATRAVQMFKQGKSVSEIAQAMGYPPGTGNNRTRNALMKAGVYAARTSPAPKQRKARTANPRPAPVLPQPVVPNDLETALKVCLQTADVNAKKLNLDATGLSTFARRLMGMVATNFGVQDFQVRKPILVLDEAAARAYTMKVASA